jgi:hypothetical protein
LIWISFSSAEKIGSEYVVGQKGKKKNAALSSELDAAKERRSQRFYSKFGLVENQSYLTSKVKREMLM